MQPVELLGHLDAKLLLENVLVELVADLRGNATLSRADYSIQWTTWEVVDMVEAPPDVEFIDPDDPPSPDAAPNLIPTVNMIGGVSVHATDGNVLAELLAHYGAESSFAREGVWTIVLPDRVPTP